MDLNTKGVNTSQLEEQKNSRVRVELKAFVLILIHTPFGLELFDKVAKWRIARFYARFNTYLMPAITALAIFLIIGSLIVMFANAQAREGVRGVGPAANLLIPGFNPYLPITYGLAALVITIIIHEAGHGVVARVYNIRVDSTGIVLFLGIPIGAFVNIERDELNRATLKQKSAVLTAGPLNNMILAGACLIAMYFVVSTLTPLPPDPNAPQFGVMVVSVNDGSLAQAMGMEAESVIQYVAGQQITSLDDLSESLRRNLGSTVEITWLNKDGDTIVRQITLPPAVEPGRGTLGVSVTVLSRGPQEVLDTYKNQFSQNPLAILLPPTFQQGFVPFSDLMAPKYTSSVFGDSFAPVANTLFWLWFINFNVGIFNALPIGPLDGGQLYGALIENKAKSKAIAKNANMLLTLVMTAIVFAVLVLPYVVF
ncbi:MAG: site-2 protease family protein [Thermoproteota archaeon]|nr:site-2 protease family protein [Thermoproteota archaeon]